DGKATLLATSGDNLTPIGKRVALDGDTSAVAAVYRTGGSARVDYSATEKQRGEIPAGALAEGARWAVGVPIMIEGALWGVLAVGSRDAASPPLDLEGRLEKFTALLATAIANADSRAELAASRARVIAAADGARRQIERDLHDGAQQQLVTLNVALRRAEAKLPPELDELRAEVGRVAEGLASAVDEL